TDAVAEVAQIVQQRRLAALACGKEFGRVGLCARGLGCGLGWLGFCPRPRNRQAANHGEIDQGSSNVTLWHYFSLLGWMPTPPRGCRGAACRARSIPRCDRTKKGTANRTPTTGQRRAFWR